MKASEHPLASRISLEIECDGKWTMDVTPMRAIECVLVCLLHVCTCTHIGAVVSLRDAHVSFFFTSPFLIASKCECERSERKRINTHLLFILILVFHFVCMTRILHKQRLVQSAKPTMVCWEQVNSE